MLTWIISTFALWIALGCIALVLMNLWEAKVEGKRTNLFFNDDENDSVIVCMGPITLLILIGLVVSKCLKVIYKYLKEAPFNIELTPKE